MSAGRGGTLIVLACHGVFDPDANVLHAEHPEDRSVYEAQLAAAFRRMTAPDADDPLLVLSGGFTKAQRKCSESRSYLDLADALGLSVPAGVVVEEHALTSIENLLLSLYTHHRQRHVYPEQVEVISWAFKRARFEATLDAIGRWAPLGESWPALTFTAVGELTGSGGSAAAAQETEYVHLLRKGVDAYYADPAVRELIARRDCHASRSLARTFYAGYPLPF